MTVTIESMNIWKTGKIVDFSFVECPSCRVSKQMAFTMEPHDGSKRHTFINCEWCGRVEILKKREVNGKD